ncbi:MAG: glutathione S-transferase C-terminal domain-containing protein, partial [bacterium]|nr:glutathione S-transferase C-terminal domain-containing protein [bacterium]
FDEKLGPPVRIWAYWHWFDYDREMVKYAGYGTPRLERWLAPYMLGISKFISSKRLGISEKSAERSLQEVKKVFQQVGEILADGRPFLTGEQFTAADLTFAALASPALLPSNYGVPLPPVEKAPPAMAAEIKGFRKSKAGKFAMDLYQRQRKTENRGNSQTFS